MFLFWYWSVLYYMNMKFSKYMFVSHGKSDILKVPTT